MTSLSEAGLHRPLLSGGDVLAVCLLMCWNLSVSRGDDDDVRTICRDTVNLRLTAGAGDVRPDRAGSGSSAADEASDSSANVGDRGATLRSRSSFIG